MKPVMNPLTAIDAYLTATAYVSNVEPQRRALIQASASLEGVLPALRLALADKAALYVNTFDSRMDVDPTVQALRDAIRALEGKANG